MVVETYLQCFQYLSAILSNLVHGAQLYVQRHEHPHLWLSIVPFILLSSLTIPLGIYNNDDTNEGQNIARVLGSTVELVCMVHSIFVLVHHLHEFCSSKLTQWSAHRLNLASLEETPGDQDRSISLYIYLNYHRVTAATPGCW